MWGVCRWPLGKKLKIRLGGSVFNKRLVSPKSFRTLAAMRPPASVVRLMVACLAGIALGATRTQAQAAVGFSSVGNSTFRDSLTRMLGWQFSVTQSVTVSALGWFDDPGDYGLNRSHEVGIWNATTQTLLASVVVPSGDTGTLVDHFRYTNLGTPLTLVAGTNYVIAGLDIGGGGDAHVWTPAMENGSFPGKEVIGFAADPRITLGGPGSAFGSEMSTFSFPTTTVGGTRTALMGPNFYMGAVPEPATVALWLGGAGGLIALLRRRMRP